MMSTQPFRAYLESRVECATPLQLVHLAYEGAIRSIAEAREHLAHKRIHERSRAVTKAQLIIMELRKTLDFRQGGDVAQQLDRLYDYILRQINDGNFRQMDAPFAQAQRLLETLDESWKDLSATERAGYAMSTAAAWPSGQEAMAGSSRTSLEL